MAELRGLTQEQQRQLAQMQQFVDENPELFEMVRQASQALGERLQALAASLEPFFESARVALSRVPRAFLTPELTRAAKAFFEGFDAALPANWRGTSGRPTIGQLMALVDAGIPVAWVPPAEALFALAAASPDQRLRVLVAHEQACFEAAEHVLDEVSDPKLAALVLAARDGLRLLRTGERRAAQVVASVTIRTIVTEALEHPSFNAASKQMYLLDRGRPMRELRRAFGLSPVSVALQPFNGVTPGGYNVSATLHFLDAGWYPEGAAHVAVLMVVSLLRQVQDDREAMELVNRLTIAAQITATSE